MVSTLGFWHKYFRVCLISLAYGEKTHQNNNAEGDLLSKEEKYHQETKTGEKGILYMV